MVPRVTESLFTSLTVNTQALPSAGATLAGEEPVGTLPPPFGVLSDPLVITVIVLLTVTLALFILLVRVTAAARSRTARWSRHLADMETRLEKSDAVLSSCSGLVLVWEDSAGTLENGWGNPEILGGRAALASLLSLCPVSGSAGGDPASHLFRTLGPLPLEESGACKPVTLDHKIRQLRTDGITFSGTIMTPDGRPVDADGCIAGGRAALWIDDPAVRMAEEQGAIGTFRDKASDLHASHALLERMDLPVWRRDTDMNLVWVNRAYTTLVEASGIQQVLKNQIEIDSTTRKTAIRASTGHAPCEQRVIINSGGERRVLLLTEIPMHDSGQAGLGGFAVDITETDRARTDLEEHMEASRRTLDQIRTAVAIFGTNQNLVYHNRAFQELWAFEDAQLAGSISHGEILDHLRIAGRLPEPADYTCWKQEQLAIYTEKISGMDIGREGGAPDEIWNLPDNRTLHVSKSRHPLGGVIVAFEDISEKLELEARYNTQIKVQKATINNLAEGVAVFGGDGTLRLYNRAFRELWRLDGALLDSRPHIDAVLGRLKNHAENGPKVLRDLRRCVTSRSPEDRQPLRMQEILPGDGRVLACGTVPLPDGATLAHFLDVTDSKEREENLRARNAILEDADRLKSKFVDHVSYQLRTPLSTIIGFSEMLDRQMFGPLNRRQQDYIAGILSASCHLRDLVSDIIDLAAIDAGKMELDLKSVDILALLENTATFSALKAEDTQVTLTVACPPDIGNAYLDDRRIRQVLVNLLANAFASSSAGDTITIGAGRTADTLGIWVRDSGHGLSETEQNTAFNTFESRGRGAGIGLALVERFIRLHNGRVQMDSAKGEGTCITCYLPLENEPETGNGHDRKNGIHQNEPLPVR